MPARVNVWWIGREFFGIGHSSVDFGTTYVTWLGGANSTGVSGSSGSGPTGSFNSSRSSSGAGSSSANSSRSSNSSSSASKVDDGLLRGTWFFADDNRTFGHNRHEFRDIPLRAVNRQWGLRADGRLQQWWRAARRIAGDYTAV